MINSSSTGDLINLATKAFNKTTGCSLNALSTYQKQPHLLNKPITPSNVGKLVTAENYYVMNGPNKMIQDRFAKLFTPVRRPIAHLLASQVAVAENGYFQPQCNYSRNVSISLISQF